MRITMENILHSDRLPSLPEVAVRVIELARSEEPDLREITAVVKADPAICAKLLKTTNSALMGLRTRATSVESAVPLLGANMIRSLVLGFTLAEQSRETAKTQQWMRYLWRRSLIQATAAELFATAGQGHDEAEWFLAGLLQDIGQLAMGSCIGNDYCDLLSTAGRQSSDVEVEVERYGFSHVDVGVALCRKWAMDERIIHAVATHHASVDEVQASAPSWEDSLSTGLVAASCCADYLLRVVDSRNADRDMLDKLLTNVFSFLPDQVTEVLDEVDSRVNEAAALFGVNIGETPPIGRILQDAQTLLAEISLRAQLTALGVKQQLAAALEHTSQLQDAAWSDDLTGVYNRRYLIPAVKLARADCERKQQCWGCLFLDVDGFKEVNDTHGHAFGDKILCKIANVLKESVRTSDYVIRYGGDEFCVILVDVNEQSLWRIAERIRERISEIRLQGVEVRVFSSIGALFLRPDARQAPRKLISHADKAMYESKKKGGDRVTAYQLRGRRKTPLDRPTEVS